MGATDRDTRRITTALRVVLVVVALAGVALVVWLVPDALYPNLTDADVEHLTAAERLEAVDRRLQLQSSARTTLTQAVGAIVVLWGAVAAWAQFSHERAKTARQRADEQAVRVA